MSPRTGPVPRWLSFRRIADIPFETCVAGLDSWRRTRHGGELRIGHSLLRGPIEYDRDTGTCRIQVRLARGPLRPHLRMRLDIDRWSPSSTAFELIPRGRVRPTAAYFRAGHLVLDSLIRSLPPSDAPAMITAGPDEHPQREPEWNGHQARPSGEQRADSAGPSPAPRATALLMRPPPSWTGTRARTCRATPSRCSSCKRCRVLLAAAATPGVTRRW